MSRRDSCTLAAALIVAAQLTVRTAAAQLCRGVPTTAVFVEGSRAQAGVTTGVLGVDFGTKTLTANAGRQRTGGDESATTLNTFGARYYWGANRESFGLCIGTGLQIGYAHIVNVEGQLMNARLTVVTIPVSVSFAGAMRLGRFSRMVFFLTPQALLQHTRTELYDRAVILQLHDNPSGFGWEAGSTLMLGPLYVRAAETKVMSNPMRWTLGVGVSR